MRTGAAIVGTRDIGYRLIYGASREIRDCWQSKLQYLNAGEKCHVTCMATYNVSVYNYMKLRRFFQLQITNDKSVEE
jgi:hypothetical protein